MPIELVQILGIVGISLFTFWAAYTAGSQNGYVDGYLDAFNGKIKLIEFPDGERKYYKEKELKDLKPPFIIIDKPFNLNNTN